MSEMCRALYEKATATRLPVRLCDDSQVNCDPDSGKVLLHTVLRPMAYTRTYRVRTVAIGFMTDIMGRMHSDDATALNK